MISLSAAAITNLHDRSNTTWHRLQQEAEGTKGNTYPLATADTEVASDPFLTQVRAQHLENFRLWHVEDIARIRSATDSRIAQAKRDIDGINQRRNDLAESLDDLLLSSLPSPTSIPSIPLHSETPGMMIDRLSILSLKHYHTREEIERIDAPAGHADRNRDRLAILDTQRADLAECLDHLWQAVLRGERRFKVYRQLKMYNDPTLNPALYKGRTNGPHN